LIVDYKKGKLAEMTPELWTAKKTIDSTLHPGSSFQPTSTTEKEQY
jgi:hypothetical protein